MLNSLLIKNKLSDPVIKMVEDHTVFMNNVSKTISEINIILEGMSENRKEMIAILEKQNSVDIETKKLVKEETPFERSVRLEKEEFNFRWDFELKMKKSNKHINREFMKKLSKAAWNQKIQRLSA